MADLIRGIVRGSAIRGESGENIPSPLWLNGYTPAEGDSVFALSDRGAVIVLGPASTSQAVDTAIVSRAASGGIVGIAAGARSLDARYIGAAPPVGSTVLLAWQGLVPWIVGVAAPVPPPALAVGGGTGDPAPPPVASSGTLTVTASDSGAWRAIDGWGRPSSRPVSTSAVMQHTFTSSPYSGAFFYGAAAQQLHGATITGIHLRLSARLSVGASGSAQTAHIYAHDSSEKPSGDVSRVVGPANISVPDGFGGGWFDLPLSFAPALLNGGGIGLYGSPYMGFAGIDADPESGQIAYDWTRS